MLPQRQEWLVSSCIFSYLVSLFLRPREMYHNSLLYSHGEIALYSPSSDSMCQVLPVLSVSKCPLAPSVSTPFCQAGSRAPCGTVRAPIYPVSIHIAISASLHTNMLMYNQLQCRPKAAVKRRVSQGYSVETCSISRRDCSRRNISRI